MAADVAINSASPDRNAAANWLTQASSLVAKLPASDSSVAEFHYRSMQLAALTEDEASRRDHADWLVRNAGGSSFELPALILTAKSVDAAVEAASGPRAAQLQQEGYQVYQRLVQLLGDGAAVLRDQNNARVASSKLARYAYDTGRFAEAGRQLEKLVAAFPKNQDYLQRCGLAFVQAGKHEQALPHWRTLVAGLSSDSTPWYEAKYYQLVCLLHPDGGPAPWRAKLKEMERVLAEP
jgi:tetratricopeptide (TPR) repeat protein